jgi:hypothetical protein
MADNGQDVQKLWKDVIGGKGKEALGDAKIKGLLYAMLTMNPAAIVKATGVLGFTKISQRAATKLLTEPKYQNLTLKAMKALKEKSPIVLNKLGEEMKRAFQKDELAYED